MSNAWASRRLHGRHGERRSHSRSRSPAGQPRFVRGGAHGRGHVPMRRRARVGLTITASFMLRMMWRDPKATPKLIGWSRSHSRSQRDRRASRVRRLVPRAARGRGRRSGRPARYREAAPEARVQPGRGAGSKWDRRAGRCRDGDGEEFELGSSTRSASSPSRPALGKDAARFRPSGAPG